jgi:hypothetical protein
MTFWTVRGRMLPHDRTSWSMRSPDSAGLFIGEPGRRAVSVRFEGGGRTCAATTVLSLAVRERHEGVRQAMRSPATCRDRAPEE